MDVLEKLPPDDGEMVSMARQILESAHLPEDVRLAWKAVLSSSSPSCFDAESVKGIPENMGEGPCDSDTTRHPR